MKDSFDSCDMRSQIPNDMRFQNFEREQERMKRESRRNAKQARKRREDYSDED